MAYRTRKVPEDLEVFWKEFLIFENQTPDKTPSGDINSQRKSGRLQSEIGNEIVKKGF